MKNLKKEEMQTCKTRTPQAHIVAAAALAQNTTKNETAQLALAGTAECSTPVVARVAPCSEGRRVPLLHHAVAPQGLPREGLFLAPLQVGQK